MGLKAPKFSKTYILQNSGHRKLFYFSKLPEDLTYYGCMLYNMYTSKTARGAKKKYFFCFYLALYDKISKVSVSRELYIVLNWLIIQNNQKTHSSINVIDVIKNTHQSRTKENGLRKEFEVFFWMRISTFLSKLNSL